MNDKPEREPVLPLRRRLTLLYLLSSVICLFMATAALGGLLYRTTVYPTEELRQAFVSNDVIMLLIGVPIPLVSMGLAWRGRLVGLLLWPGALLFVLYNAITYAAALPLGVVSLLHLALVGLTLYTTIGLVASIDGEAVRRRLAGAVPGRAAGGILAGLGLLFFLRAAVVMVNALIGDTPLPGAERALNSVDFLVAPAWVVCGVLLWRRKALGYVTGLGALFQASTLFIGLVLVLLLQPLMTGEPMVVTDVVVVLLMGLVCFIPLALYLRGVVAGRSAASP